MSEQAGCLTLCRKGQIPVKVLPSGLVRADVPHRTDPHGPQVRQPRHQAQQAGSPLHQMRQLLGAGHVGGLPPRPILGPGCPGRRIIEDGLPLQPRGLRLRPHLGHQLGIRRRWGDPMPMFWQQGQELVGGEGLGRALDHLVACPKERPASQRANHGHAVLPNTPTWLPGPVRGRELEASGRVQGAHRGSRVDGSTGALHRCAYRSPGGILLRLGLCRGDLHSLVTR